ncbi:hypothetical protein SDC9_191917 [bioreactor metagenome]|uniref:Uncharacterized protein n=1 Tax=bioreactor metagenome TaxID=1076179 RepID=A0A645I0T1_9ZZZZ
MVGGLDKDDLYIFIAASFKNAEGGGAYRVDPFDVLVGEHPDG